MIMIINSIIKTTITVVVVVVVIIIVLSIFVAPRLRLFKLRPIKRQPGFTRHVYVNWILFYFYRGLCCHAVSVRPSVTFVDHVKTNKHIFQFFSPSGSDTILVFP